MKFKIVMLVFVFVSGLLSATDSSNTYPVLNKAEKAPLTLSEKGKSEYVVIYDDNKPPAYARF